MRQICPRKCETSQLLLQIRRWTCAVLTMKLLTTSSTNSTWNTDMLELYCWPTLSKGPLVSCACSATIQSCSYLRHHVLPSFIHLSLGEEFVIILYKTFGWNCQLPSETKRNLEEVKKFHILIPIAKELEIHICALNFSRNDPTISIFLAHFYLL